MPPASPQIILNLGVVAGVLSIFWLCLQMIAWFRPKESYATKSELSEAKREISELRKDVDNKLGGIEMGMRTLETSIQAGFKDLHRAIGVLEGKASVS